MSLAFSWFFRVMSSETLWSFSGHSQATEIFFLCLSSPLEVKCQHCFSFFLMLGGCNPSALLWVPTFFPLFSFPLYNYKGGGASLFPSLFLPAGPGCLTFVRISPFLFFFILFSRIDKGVFDGGDYRHSSLLFLFPPRLEKEFSRPSLLCATAGSVRYRHVLSPPFFFFSPVGFSPRPVRPRRGMRAPSVLFIESPQGLDADCLLTTESGVRQSSSLPSLPLFLFLM